jgi:hypothetical protein
MSKNIYHRYLKIPFEYSKPTLFNTKYTHANMICLPSNSIDNSAIEWIKSFNLKVSNVIEGFYTPVNGGKLPIHNDTPTISDAVKINFTWGPENSVTRWWEVKDVSSLIPITPDNSQIESLDITPDIEINSAFSAKEENCNLVYEQVINKPSLMNIGQLHSTYNPHTTEDRWTLCFTVLKLDNSHLQFDEALRIFKDIAYE